MKKEVCELVGGGTAAILRPESKEDVQKLVENLDVDVSEVVERGEPDKVPIKPKKG